MKKELDVRLASFDLEALQALADKMEASIEEVAMFLIWREVVHTS
jgi:hypothetical protein